MENKINMDLKPLLTICIPIYNRLNYLHKMLSRFLEDKNLFINKIELLVSDNCSEENLKDCVDSFKRKGLVIKYNRNNRNLGADGNFEYCFAHLKGKYCWLLGSDDIPVSGFIRNVVNLLDNKEYGLLHINCYNVKKNGITEYNDNNKCIEDINYWITFMSSNIINSKFIKLIDNTQYIGSYLMQVPYYIYSCLNSKINAIYSFECFEKENENINNGGYNIFEVFVENLFLIYSQFVDNGMLKKRTFERMKKKEYEFFLFRYIVTCLILKKNKRFKTSNGWHILIKNYGSYFYFYFYPFKYFIEHISNFKKGVYSL